MHFTTPVDKLIWCPGRESNLRRLAGVSESRSDERETAAEILSAAKDQAGSATRNEREAFSGPIRQLRSAQLLRAG